MNNSCKTITEHNKSFIRNINGKKWDFLCYAKIWRPSELAWEIIVHLFSVRDKFFSGITLAREAQCQKLKTLKKSHTDVSVMFPQIRRDTLSLKYYYKVKTLPQNPAFRYIISEQETLCALKNYLPLFAIRVQKIHKNWTKKKNVSCQISHVLD